MSPATANGLYMVGLLIVDRLSAPHFAIGEDVVGGGLWVDLPVVAAERLEAGEPLRNAGMVQEVIEGVFDQTGIPAAILEDVSDGRGEVCDRLLVERLERSDGCCEVTEQALVSV